MLSGIGIRPRVVYHLETAGGEILESTDDLCRLVTKNKPIRLHTISATCDDTGTDRIVYEARAGAWQLVEPGADSF